MGVETTDYLNSILRIWNILQQEGYSEKALSLLKKEQCFAHIIRAHKIEAAFVLYCRINSVKLLKNGKLEESAVLDLCAKTLYDKYLTHFLGYAHFPIIGLNAKEFHDFLQELVKNHEILEVVEIKGKKYYLTKEKVKTYRLAIQYKSIFCQAPLNVKKRNNQENKKQMSFLF